MNELNPPNPHATCQYCAMRERYYDIPVRWYEDMFAGSWLCDTCARKLLENLIENAPILQ